MIARAGPGAAAYPRGSHTWNGTSPTLTAKPAISSACAVSRPMLPGTRTNEARSSEPERAASKRSPERRRAPVNLAKARVNLAPAGPSGSSPLEPGKQVERDCEQFPGQQGGEGIGRCHEDRDGTEGERVAGAEAAPADRAGAGRPGRECQRHRDRRAERDHQEEPGQSVGGQVRRARPEP